MRTLAAVAAIAVATAARAGDPGYGKPEGVLPHAVLGPKVMLVSFPAPGFGVEAKALNLVGVSFDYGFIPDVSVSGVSVGLTSWSLAARVYPFRGAFCAGVALGSREFHGSKTDASTGTPVKAKATVTSTFVAPEIGWRWVWSSGLFLGMDLGWQFVLSDRATLEANGASVGTQQDVQDQADRIGKAGLPVLGLLQLGWFF
ncbi:MAG TPA: hypothetical protein VLD85_02635 [Anaeromyxobacteraceae bacterium]|nr:hypothetical protein [Anaeromyxobacteraceae bacterium]